MAKKTSADTKRTKVKDLPRPKEELTGKDLRKVKGGSVANFGDIKGESTEDYHKGDVH
jgi:hypothetical protein